ncbi:MAG: hypothetical protein ACK4N5_18330, partial [Myxococcales bacterium]
MVRLLAALVVMLGAPALAASLRPLSVAELTQRADTVVRARVVYQASVRSERSGRTLTRTRLAVVATL